MTRSIIAVVMLLGASFASADPSVVYSNDRFGYWLSYPTEFFSVGTKSDNGDGFTSQGGKGEATLRAYASHNALDETLKSLLVDGLGKAEWITVDYNAPGKFFVFKVLSSGVITVQKTVLKNHVIATVQVEYPKDKANKYDTPAFDVLNSFDTSRLHN